MSIRNQIAEFKAQVTFLTTSEGGRKTYAKSGIRTLINFDEKHLDGCELIFFDKEKANPGEVVTCDVRMIYIAPWHLQFITAGNEFKLQEGIRIVAGGKILEVYQKLELT